MKRLEKEFIVVGLASILPVEAIPCGLADRLSASDQGRAARFRQVEDRARFVVGRALLGKLLRNELDYRPAVLELTLTEQGRPYLPALPHISFSISHAGEWVAVALGLGIEVGIDVESLDRRLDLEPLAQRIFDPADLAQFQALPESIQARAFFRAWTGKEAVLKAKGLGLFGGVREMRVPLDDQPAAVHDPTAGGTNWHVQPVAVPNGYTASLASNRPWDSTSPTVFTLSDLEWPA